MIRFVTERPEVTLYPDYPDTKAPTIPHAHKDSSGSPGPSPSTLALVALGWILDDENRAKRFLSLTGLDPESLRAGLDDPAVLAAPLEFLANHEPDLIRAAEALAITPEELIAAHRELSR